MASARPLPAARRDDLVERAFARLGAPRLLAALLAVAALVAALAGPARRAGAAFEAGSDGGLAFRLYLALELYDPLHAWPFALLLVLALASALAFGLARLPAALAALHPAPRLTDDVARGLRAVARLDAAGPDAAARVEAAFRAEGFAPSVAREGAATYLFAERGRLARLAPPIAALGLALLLAGALARTLLGWDADAEIPEGAFVGAVPARTPTGEAYRRSLPFVARLDALDVPDAGAPRPTRAAVSLYNPSGRPLPDHRGEDLVLRGIAEGGVAISLGGVRAVPGAERATLALTDKTSGVRRELLAARDEPVDTGAGVTFTVIGSTAKYGEIGPAVQVRRAEGGRTTEFWVFQARPDFDGKNRPDRFALEFQGLRPTYAATLHLAREPGLPLVAGGAFVALAAGALAALGVHRRAWARVEPGRAVLAASSSRSRAASDALVAALRDGVDGRRAGGGEATA
jgi:cytochrome c biogenesis protein ResB